MSQAALLAAVAAHGLPGSTAELPDEPLTTNAWSDFLNGVRSQRLTGLLVAAVAEGALTVTEEQAETASEAHFAAVCDSLLLEAGALRTIAILEEAGVEPRVLKGTAVAHLDYPDPTLRLFGDIDLIVRGEQFDEAVAALVTSGHPRRYPQPRPGFDRRFSKGTSFTTTEGLEIDLHRTFVMGPYGLRLVLADVWATPRPFTLAGRTLHALDDEVRFLHACFHAALGDYIPRLVPQRDVAQMLLSGRLDLARVEELTRRWGAAPVVARAVCLAWDTLSIADVTHLSTWARRYVPSAAAARDLAVYLDPKGSYAAKSLAAVHALPRFRDKVSFATALAFPQSSYVEGRHDGSLQRLRGGLRAALRRGAP